MVIKRLPTMMEYIADVGAFTRGDLISENEMRHACTCIYSVTVHIHFFFAVSSLLYL